MLSPRFDGHLSNPEYHKPPQLHPEQQRRLRTIHAATETNMRRSKSRHLKVWLVVAFLMMFAYFACGNRTTHTDSAFGVAHVHVISQDAQYL